MAFILSAAVPWPPRDDGAGVAHAAARRRGLAGDEAHDRLLHVLLDELRRSFLGGAADLADHDDGFGLGIVVEQPQRVDVRGADDGIAADADAVDWPMPRCVSWCTAS